MGLILSLYQEPPEHVNGRTIVGRADPGDMYPLAEYEYDTIPGPNEPPDPVRSSQFEDYETDTGVYAAGIKHSRQSLATWINPFQKNGTKWQYNENDGTGKPPVIFDVRGRVLDDRMQSPGQQRFRYDTSIPRPAYMSFSDLLDQEGVY